MGLFTRIRENRLARLQIKQDAKTQRTLIKFDAKKTAYSNGIDPTSAMWSSIGGIAQGVGNVVGGALGGVPMRQNSILDIFGGGTDENGNIRKFDWVVWLPVIMGVFGFLYLVFSKKKR